MWWNNREIGFVLQGGSSTRIINFCHLEYGIKTNNKDYHSEDKFSLSANQILTDQLMVFR